MTLSLKQLADRIGSASVVVRGTTVQVRALSAAECDRIDRLHPHPAPPVRPDPTKGSKAAYVPDRTDPAYQNAMNDRNRAVAYCEVAAGVDWLTAGGLRYRENATEKEARDYFTAAAAEVANAFTPAEIVRLKKAQDALEAGEGLAEVARGNSSLTPDASGDSPPPNPGSGPPDTAGPAN